MPTMLPDLPNLRRIVSSRSELRNVTGHYIAAADSLSEISRLVGMYNEKWRVTIATSNEAHRSLGEIERRGHGDKAVLEYAHNQYTTLSKCLEEDELFAEDINAKLDKCLKKLEETRVEVTKMKKNRSLRQEMETELKKGMEYLWKLRLVIRLNRDDFKDFGDKAKIIVLTLEKLDSILSKILEFF